MPAVLVVTTEGVPGYEITSVIGQVVGSIARLSNAFTEGIRTMDGQLNPRRSQDLAQWRRDAVNEMVEEARRQGANAIIGMRFDNRGISTAWAEICAYGTAVRVDPQERPPPEQPPRPEQPAAPPPKPPVDSAPASTSSSGAAAASSSGAAAAVVPARASTSAGAAAPEAEAEAPADRQEAPRAEHDGGTRDRPARRWRRDTGERVGPELMADHDADLRPSPVGWPEEDGGPEEDGAGPTDVDGSDKPDPDWPDTPTDPSLRAPD